jgi:hypothetical protein
MTDDEVIASLSLRPEGPTALLGGWGRDPCR